MSIRPRKLKEGETIGIIAPAGPVSPGCLEKGIAYLEARGYKIKLGSYVRNTHGYLAGTDTERAEDFNRMFADDAINAVFCSRGGYGTPRLLSRIDYQQIKHSPKILVGFSDITALQLALFAKSGLVTFSGPMVAAEMGKDKDVEPFTARHFWEMVTGSQRKFRLTNLDGSLKALKGGQARGKLLGGCLSLICSLIGTPFLPNFRDAILFIEDVGEAPYRIDRKLMQLKLAGILSQISGLVIGQFENCLPEEDRPSLTIERVFEETFDDLKIPIVTGLPYGHIDVKYTIPVGVEAFLNADDGYLEILETPVIP